MCPQQSNVNRKGVEGYSLRRQVAWGWVTPAGSVHRSRRERFLCLGVVAVGFGFLCVQCVQCVQCPVLLFSSH